MLSLKKKYRKNEKEKYEEKCLDEFDFFQKGPCGSVQLFLLFYAFIWLALKLLIRGASFFAIRNTI